MKVSNYEQMWKSENENVFVFYNQFGMGAKYDIYRKVSYDGNIRAEYLISFKTIGEAIEYAKQVYDKIIDK